MEFYLNLFEQLGKNIIADIIIWTVAVFGTGSVIKRFITDRDNVGWGVWALVLGTAITFPCLLAVWHTMNIQF